MTPVTVLITGAGTIGRTTAALLAAEGRRCLLADITAVPDLPVECVACDITDIAALEALIVAREVQAVIHTAAMLATGLRSDPLRGLEVNLMGTANVLEASRRCGVERVVCISSATVLYPGFGSLPPGPIPEDAALRLLSDRPSGLYPMCKLAGEHMALLWRDLYGLSTVSLRFGAVLGGEGSAPTSIPGRLLRLLVDAARSGTRVHVDDPVLVWSGDEEFVDLRDCAGAIRAALDAPDPKQGVYAIAYPALHTMESFVAVLDRVMGPVGVTWPEGVTTGFAGFAHTRPGPSDTSAALRELGFSCRHDLEDTLRHWHAG